jgi:hypothetical protein
MIYNDQILFNWSQGAMPQLVGEGDNQKKLSSYDDMMLGLTNAEQALGQKILQDNQGVLYVQDLISEQGLTELSGAATLADVIATQNSIITILNNLVQNPQ